MPKERCLAETGREGFNNFLFTNEFWPTEEGDPQTQIRR